MSTSNTSSHEKIQKKKKKNHRVPHWPGGTPPPQGLELFFSLECGSKLFSQPLQRATTSPQSLGSAEGVEPGGRGAYVTRQTQGQPVGERNAQRNDRERGRRVCIWKVFSTQRRGPSLCESDDEWNRKAKCNGVKKNLPCLLSGLEAEGTSLKALGLLPKTLFPTISKGHNQLRGSGRSFSMIHFWVTLRRHSTKRFFCLHLQAS